MTSAICALNMDKVLRFGFAHNLFIANLEFQNLVDENKFILQFSVVCIPHFEISNFEFDSNARLRGGIVTRRLMAEDTFAASIFPWSPKHPPRFCEFLFKKLFLFVL